ncbi:TolB family protein [Nocardioides taihuensis]|uniref:TolB family protein n=1 Tax=Nocardioides taihuensis TaxID=1835606 RepID=A0ABW0BHN4_9ACTN
MATHRTRAAALVAATLTSLTALAAISSAVPAVAGVIGAGPVEQVALVDGTGAQLVHESHVNGSANVVSYDGRYTAFSTDAPLVPADTNGVDDVYVRDREAGTTTLVSVRRDGGLGNDYSYEPTISDDGRYVAFTTWATNLATDRNGSHLDVLVKDLATGKLSRVSLTSGDRQLKPNSFFPVISGDGRSVAFQTFARLGSKDGDRTEDVYVRDLDTGTTRQASLQPDGRDIREGVIVGDISDDGRRVAVGNDRRIWVRDLVAGTTTRVWQEPVSPPCQPDPMGSAGRPAISGNGSFVAFSSCATDLPGEDGTTPDIYVLRLRDGVITRAHPKGDHESFIPSLSRTGRFVGFGSDATNLVEGDDEGQPDAFVVDRRTGEVVRASQAPDGSGGNSWNATTAAAISGDGHSLAFSSYSSNLVVGDEHDLEEAFVWHR